MKLEQHGAEMKIIITFIKDYKTGGRNNGKNNKNKL